MYTAMKALPRHPHPMSTARLLCLTVMTILIANPVLAAVSAALACDGRCCCADAGEAAAVRIRSLAPTQADCCRPTEAAPCNMSPGSLPDPAPALVHPPDRQTTDPVQLLSADSHTAADLLPSTAPGSRVTGVPDLSDPPVYLRTCHLIC
jgi:hypothetical protein